MLKNVLVRTNFLVCSVIVMGFLIASAASFFYSRGIYMKDMEHISHLTTTGIYYRLEAIFAKPIGVSLTMANDDFLIDFIRKESSHLDDESYTETIRKYLDTYRKKYSYDSVFFVSVKTRRHYHFTGIDRVIVPGNPENDWYYNFLKADADYILDVDNDEADDGDEITVFVDSAVRDKKRNIIGITGVGFKVDYLQSLLREYEEKFGVKALLVDETGIIEISTGPMGHEKVNHFDTCGYPEQKRAILDNKRQKNIRSFWLNKGGSKNYITSQYIPSLSWHLIVESNTKALNEQTRRRFLFDFLLALAVVTMALAVITSVIRVGNRKIVSLTEEKNAAFRDATERLFDTIYEVNITENRAATSQTEQYFETFGVNGDGPFDQILRVIASRTVKKEYREGYLEVFMPKNVLKEYENGNADPQYEFQIILSEEEYRWTRAYAHVHHCEEDGSIRMFVYFQNIESEKQKEIQAQTDKMTELYNKDTAERLVRQALSECGGENLFAFIILDIDNFKSINDSCGHAVGDLAITEFASIIQRNFRKGDILGRMGGDEFMAFVPIPSIEWAEKKVSELSKALCGSHSAEGKTYSLSASIGVSFAPKDGADFETLYKNADSALYRIKEMGKNGYALFSR
ncbi:hypothetical protein FACS1894216_08640 [Synergistales bacterium]|nr:hypothetical protein FACS1894216_08640 [Synergistales bacterium]